MAAGRLVWPQYMPARDSDGAPLPDARMSFYENETTDLATVYTNSALTTPLSNPVAADSSGYFPNIWAEEDTLFSVSIESPSTGLIRTIDGLSASNGGGGGGTVTFATAAEIQTGTVPDHAIAPDQASLGMPVVYRSITQSTRPDPAVANGVGGIANAFNGSQVANSIRIKSLLTGTALGTPATGYLYTEETAPARIYFVNRAGHNEATDSNVGRTGGFAMRVSVTANQTVQGDSIAYSAAVSVGGARAGATSFLANPAGGLFSGDCVALNAGVFLNPREINLIDSGFDVAGIGDVLNLNRSVATGALGATWIGYRPQSVGTQDIDAFYSMRGKGRIGLDTTTAAISGASITLAGNQQIAMNATNVDPLGFPDNTALGTEFFKYDTTAGAFQFVKGGSVVGSVNANGFNGLEGNGSPEGVVNAGPGTLYKQLDGANGSTLWAKRAGTGTTNWETLGSQPNRAIIAKAGIIVSDGFLITGLVGGVARRMTEYLASGVLQVGDSAASYLAIFNDVRPDGSRNLGNSAARWQNIYLVNAPDVSSDARQKTEEEYPEGLLQEIKGLKMRAYRRNEGSGIRSGVFAQDVIACFDRAGVDWRGWDIVHEDENGEYSVVYDHLFALKIAALEA